MPQSSSLPAIPSNPVLGLRSSLGLVKRNICPCSSTPSLGQFLSQKSSATCLTMQGGVSEEVKDSTKEWSNTPVLLENRLVGLICSSPENLARRSRSRSNLST